MDSARHKISMDGGWKFTRVTPDLPVDTEYSYDRTKSGNRRMEALLGFDDSGWLGVDLPHDWAAGAGFAEQHLISHGYRERGSGLYRRVFRLDGAYEGRQLTLCFCGVSNRCTVYFNGSVAARNFSGYNEFTVDITDRAFFGDRENVLMLHVDAEDIEGWWYEGAGIYRHVWLYVKDAIHIAHNGIFVKPQKGEGLFWSVGVETEIENSRLEDETSATFSIISEIRDGSKLLVSSRLNNALCAAGTTTGIRQALPVEDPELWDVDAPRLYELRVRLLQSGREIDCDSAAFGFRTIGISAEKGFFLNGRPLKLKGACIHQDHAGVGVALPDSIHDYRVRRLRDMGCNACRCAHHMPARELLDACDRHGVLVMDENRHFESTPETLLHVETMVRRDRNHPCVVFYSLFNEEPLAATEEGRGVFRRMKKTVKRLDGTRLITGAMNVNTMLAPNGAALEMDVTGFNYYMDNYDVFHGRYPAQPVVGSETCGTCSTRGCYASDHALRVLNCYDEEHSHCFESVRYSWKMIREREYIAGMFIWSGFDYRGEPAFLWPSVSSQFGLMDTCGIPKDAFFFAKACYSDRPMMHLLPHWNWKAGDIVKVMTVTNCEEAELFVNGRSLGRKRSNVYEQCAWQVAFEPGVLSAAGYNGGVAAASDEVRTAGRPCRISIVPDRDTLRDDGADAVAVNVCVTDERGTVVPDAGNHMEFELSGDGRILGTGNGDPNSHENDSLPERNLFAGWCQVLVQAAKGAGSLILRASSQGFEAAAYEFRLKRENA